MHIVMPGGNAHSDVTALGTAFLSMYHYKRRAAVSVRCGPVTSVSFHF